MDVVFLWRRCYYNFIFAQMCWVSPDVAGLLGQIDAPSEAFLCGSAHDSDPVYEVVLTEQSDAIIANPPLKPTVLALSYENQHICANIKL